MVLVPRVAHMPFVRDCIFLFMDAVFVLVITLRRDVTILAVYLFEHEE